MCCLLIYTYSSSNYVLCNYLVNSCVVERFVFLNVYYIIIILIKLYIFYLKK